MKNTRISKFLIIYTLYFMLALGIYGFLFFHIESKSDTISKTFSDIEREKMQSAQMQDLQHLVKSTEEGRAKLINYFVDEDKIIEFLETIEGLAKIAQVDMNVNNLGEGGEDEALTRELRVSIDFEGEWKHVHHFLVLLEDIPIKMSVDRLTIRESSKSIVDEETGEATQKVIWKASVDFRTLQVKK